MERDGMVFYRSFADAIKELPADQQLSCLWSIIDYGLDGVECDLTGLVKCIFNLAKPQIDANNKRYINGKKGGAPKGNSNAKKQAENNLKQPTVDSENNLKQPKEKDKEKEKEKDKDINNFKIEQTRSANALFERVWSIYPEKKGKARVSDKDKRKLLEIGFDHIERAITRYKKEITESDSKHYQHGSTFFHSGIYDYLDDTFSKSTESDLNKAHEKPTFKQVEQTPSNAMAYRENTEAYQSGTPMPFERSLASEMLRRKREKKA